MVRIRAVAIVTLLGLTAFVLPAARGQEGSNEPELPPGTVTVIGEFTSGKFLDPGEVTGPDQTTLVYYEYDLVDHDLVFWVFPSVDGEPTSVIGYGEVAQRTELEMDHFLNDEPVTTRRAFTAVTEMDFEGTWDGNDPGSVKGIVTWTVPEERVDVEWNEHSWGPVPSPTNGIYTGPGWTDGTFTATWSPSTGEMRGEIDTGPWNGGFEASMIATESSPISSGPPASLPCDRPLPYLFDVGPGGAKEEVFCVTESSAGLERGTVGILAALQLGPDDRQVLRERRRLAMHECRIPELRIACGAEGGGTVAQLGLLMAHQRMPDHTVAYPSFRAAVPLFGALARAESTAAVNGDKKGRERARAATIRLMRMLFIWEAHGGLPEASS